MKNSHSHCAPWWWCWKKNHQQTKVLLFALVCRLYVAGFVQKGKIWLQFSNLSPNTYLRKVGAADLCHSVILHVNWVHSVHKLSSKMWGNEILLLHFQFCLWFVRNWKTCLDVFWQNNTWRLQQKPNLLVKMKVHVTACNMHNIICVGFSVCRKTSNIPSPIQYWKEESLSIYSFIYQV